jgi:hypothetical protein
MDINIQAPETGALYRGKYALKLFLKKCDFDQISIIYGDHLSK